MERLSKAVERHERMAEAYSAVPRQTEEGGKQAVTALTSLANELRGIQLGAALPDLEGLATRVSVINHCNNGSFPGTMFLYAVMPEFFTDFATQYVPLQQRCGASTRIRLNSLHGLTESELLRQIGQKVVEIYSVAYDFMPEDPAVVDGNLKVLAATCIQRSMETGARRAMVKICVQMLNEARENGLTALTAQTAERLMEGVREDVREQDAKQVDTEGE